MFLRAVKRRGWPAVGGSLIKQSINESRDQLQFEAGLKVGAVQP